MIDPPAPIPEKNIPTPPSATPQTHTITPTQTQQNIKKATLQFPLHTVTMDRPNQQQPLKRIMIPMTSK